MELIFYMAQIRIILFIGILISIGHVFAQETESPILSLIVQCDEFFEGRLFIGTLNDGQLQQITHSDTIGGRWIDEGDSLYISLREDGKTISQFIKDVTSNPSITSIPFNFRFPSISPDGQQALANKDKMLYLWSLSDATKTQIGAVKDIVNVAWSPFGGYFVYVDDKGKIIRVAVDNLISYDNLLSSVESLQEFSWSPDEKWLAILYSSNQAQILKLINLETHITVTHVFDLGQFTPDADLIWSPDSQEFIFSLKTDVGSDLYIIEPMHVSDFDDTQKVYSTNGSYLYPTSWSPDGQYILIGYGDIDMHMSGGHRIGLYEIAKNELTFITPISYFARSAYFLPARAYPLAIGEQAFVVDDGLKLYKEPSLSAESVSELVYGAGISLVDKEQSLDDVKWWQVQTSDKQIGWIREDIDGLKTLRTLTTTELSIYPQELDIHCE